MLQLVASMPINPWSSYAQARKVPRKVEYSGNKNVAASYLRTADKQLARMEERMRLSRPKPLNIDSQTVHLKDEGVIIETWSCYSLQGVKITTLPVGVPLEAEDTCFCQCHMSEGQVSFADDTQDHIYSRFINNPVSYNVNLCETGTYLSMIENVMASDFQKYKGGDKVVVLWIGESYLNHTTGCTIKEDCRILPIIPNYSGYTLL